MAQRHLDRLTATDAWFLHQESPSAHMHIGGLLVFEGPAPPFAELLDHIRSRLHMVPRYRQKLSAAPAATGRPLWIDDPSFDLEHHVRNCALPAPGSDRQLLELAALIASQPLDRTRPLWEFWLVQGLARTGSGGERFAMISKSHHALVDGVSGVDLATTMLDFSAAPAPIDTTALRPWRPQPEPDRFDLLRSGLRDSAARLGTLGLRAATAAAQPGRSARRLGDAVQGLGALVWAGLSPAPQTPLNVPIGPHRRFTVVRHSLSDYRLVKDEFGATVNDVLLAVVSGALRTWFRSRGIPTEGVELSALVPVSVRTPAQHLELGNRLTAMRVPLPVYIGDPIERLRVVSAATRDLKTSKQAIGAATLVAAGDLAPAALLAQAARLRFSTRLFNLLVTNVPGPQVPLYALGRRLVDLFPLPFLPPGHALAVAIISYDGQVQYGLLADSDALPDLAVLAEGIDESLRELLAGRR
jgi:WS/DGAT/MGAT family acyltransferase